MSSLLIKRRILTEKLEKNQANAAVLEKIVTLVHNVRPLTRGSQIVHAAISAAGVIESEIQTQPAYPVRQLEQVAQYSCPQNFQQASESNIGTKDVLFSMSGTLQKKKPCTSQV